MQENTSNFNITWSVSDKVSERWKARAYWVLRIYHDMFLSATGLSLSIDVYQVDQYEGKMWITCRACADNAKIYWNAQDCDASLSIYSKNFTQLFNQMLHFLVEKLVSIMRHKKFTLSDVIDLLQPADKERFQEFYWTMVSDSRPIG